MPDSKANHLAALSGILPGFAAYWESDVDFNEGDFDEHTLCGIFWSASRVTQDLLSAGNTESVRNVLDYIEGVMQTGASDEGDAAVTCFLENLLNVTPTEIEPKTWIPHLGSDSRAFCRAWDDFTGCRTEYLHEDQPLDD